MNIEVSDARVQQLKQTVLWKLYANVGDQEALQFIVDGFLANYVNGCLQGFSTESDCMR